MNATVTESLSVSPNPVPYGGAATFNVSASSTTNNLSSFSFYVTGPGVAPWLYIGNVTAHNSTNGYAALAWTPPASGSWSVACQAWSAAGTCDQTQYAAFTAGLPNHQPQGISLQIGANSGLSPGGNAFGPGQSLTITARATDVDGNLSSFSYYVSGPGLPTWTYITNVPASGGDATKTINWTPPRAGSYQVTFQAWDTSGAVDGSQLTSFTVQAPQFKILVDTNSATATDLQAASTYAADGVYLANIGNPSLAAYLPAALQALHAERFAASEDTPTGGDTYRYLPSHGYVGTGPMVYLEYDNGFRSTLTLQDLDTAYRNLGRTILVTSRSYATGDARQGYVDTALNSSECAGVVFEQVPSTITNSVLYTQNLNGGIYNSLMRNGKQAYVLLSNSDAGDGSVFEAKILQSLKYFAESGMLGNPNFYVVVASYNGVGTFTGSTDSVKAAVQALQQYRAGF